PADPKTAQQFREAKTQQLLTGLAGRCQKMLESQLAVHEGTKNLHQRIQGTPDKKAGPEDQQVALRLVAKQKEIVLEAADLLKAEEELGAVAFPEVLRQLRDDMKRVQESLEVSDVGVGTQATEEDIIETLKEMIRALTKG